ncbi:MAG: ATPase, partial [Acidimicrobiales bacterium]|nr:ATPase [Acidimicrobiales bacterium]
MGKKAEPLVAAVPSAPPAPAPPIPSDWTTLADALLQRAALVMRIAQDRAPDPMAGLRVDSTALAALLATLPGLVAGDNTAVAAVQAELQPGIDGAVADFSAWLGQAAEGYDARGRSLRHLIDAVGLSGIEAAVLAVLAAVELDPRRQRIVGYLNDDVSERRLTPYTLVRLFEGVADDLAAVERAVGPGGGLQAACLISNRGTQPWASLPIVVAPSLAWHLVGDDHRDRDLPGGAEVFDGPGTAGVARLVTAAGPDRVRRLQAAIVALAAPRFLVCAVPGSNASWDAVIRHATLGGMGVVLELTDEPAEEARDRIEAANHLVWGLTSRHDLALTCLPRGPLVDVSTSQGLPLVSPGEWAAVFGNDVAHSHRLTAEQLHLVGRAAEAVGGDITAAVRRLAAGRIDQFATRIRPARGMEDIVLDEAHAAQLREIVARARYREMVFDEWGFRSDPSTGVIAL